MSRLKKLTGAPGAILAGLIGYGALLALADVGPAASFGYLGYELVFVGLPGVLAYLALTGSGNVGPRALATGWALGIAMEMGAFSLTASLGIRDVFLAYPAFAVVAAAPFVRFRPRSLRMHAGRSWALLACSALLLGWIANALLATPLPSQIGSIKDYSTDLLWETSLTGEALHHWPVQLPDLAGMPLHYHYFAFLHLAAGAQVTGLQPWWIVFRLFPVVAAVVIVGQLAAVGVVIGRTASAGIGTFILYLVVGRFFPWPSPSVDVVYTIWSSPSFAVGLMLFLGLVLELEALTSSTTRRSVVSSLIVLGALGVAETGTKVPAAIVLLGSTGILLGFSVLRARDLVPKVAAALVVLVASYVVIWADVFRGGPRGATNFDLFGVVKSAEPFHAVVQRAPHALEYLVLAVGALLGALKLTAPLVPGLIGARSPASTRVLLLSGLGVGMALYLCFFDVGSSELYFLWYGLAAGAPLAAAGWDRLLRTRLSSIRADTKVISTAVLLLFVLWAVDMPGHSEPSSGWWANLGHHRVNEPRYVALRWLTHNTSPSAVIAVDQRADPMFCYVTAYSERRALDGCYLGLVSEKLFGSPSQIKSLLPTSSYTAYRRRAELNAEIFAGDPAAALTAEHEFRVQYILLWRPAHVAALASVSRPVFQNAAATILRLDLPR